MARAEIALVNLTSANGAYCEPLGVCYLASALRRIGWSVALYDVNSLDNRECSQLAKRITDTQYDVVGLSAVEQNLPDLVHIAEELRSHAPRTTVIAGGYGPSFWARELVSVCPGVTVVRGEAESVLPRIVRCLLEHDEPSGIEGVVYTHRGEVFDSGWCSQSYSLDHLPWPARDLAPYALSTSAPLAVLSRRGCYGHCSFCSVREFYKSHRGATTLMRVRRVDDVVSEVCYLVELGAERVQFSDTNFFDRNDTYHVDSFIEAMGSRAGRPVEFSIKCRIEDVITYSNHLLRMKEVGLDHIFVGLESGNQEDLMAFNKEVTREQCIEALGILERLGVRFSLGLILFGPYTSRRGLADTLELVRQYSYDVDVVSKLEAFRGTPITRRLQREGRLAEGLFSCSYELSSETQPFWDRWARAKSILWQMLARSGLAGRFRCEPEFRREVTSSFIDALLSDLSSAEQGVIRSYSDLVRELGTCFQQSALGHQLQRRLESTT